MMAEMAAAWVRADAARSAGVRDMPEAPMRRAA
jgi:hypothetical protein